ncbi:MAG: cell division protein FtsX [Candidatus Paceibacterales bacterium]
MFTNFKRAFKFAFADVSRSWGISLAAILILTVTIFSLTGLFFLHGITQSIIGQVQNKTDITAYFKTDTQEADILTAKDKLASLDPDIKNIQYISKDQALAIFTQKHQDNPVYTNALNQVGDNPLLASLNITTNGDPAQYQKIAAILAGDQFSALVDHVDFSQKKRCYPKNL